jgi:hypothetical protein
MSTLPNKNTFEFGLSTLQQFPSIEYFILGTTCSVLLPNRTCLEAEGWAWLCPDLHKLETLYRDRLDKG